MTTDNIANTEATTPAASTPNKLTASKVKETLYKCFFNDEELAGVIASFLPAHGVAAKLGFHAGRVEENAALIKELCDQLPEAFQEKGGEGGSFLNACVTRDGEQWGEHINVDELLMLGLASGWVQYNLPRDQWGMFPGGMPYFKVLAERVKVEPMPNPNYVPPVPEELKDPAPQANEVSVVEDEFSSQATDPAPAAEEQTAQPVASAPAEG